VNLGALLHSFVQGQEFQSVVLLVLLDFVLGVCAALKLGTFALSYVANFARNDVLSKVVPFFILNSAALVAGSHNMLSIPEFDLNNVKDAAYGVIVAAMVGSIVTSLADLGLGGRVALPTIVRRGGAPTSE
jgi:hypothetical protein